MGLNPGPVNCLRSHSAVVQATATGVSLRSIVVDFGVRLDHSNRFDFDASDPGFFPSVSDMILYETDPRQIDLVFIDGPFQAACLMKAASVLRDDAVIIVHDYKEGTYADRATEIQLVEKVSSLAIFRRSGPGIETKMRGTKCPNIKWQFFFQGLDKKPFA